MLSGIQTYEFYVMKSFYSGSYSHSCTDLLKKTLTFIHFPLRLLWLNQKEVSGLRELKAATIFPLWWVTWFPFIPWKTSWFWLFSLSGMRYNSTPAARSPVLHRKLLHFGPSPLVQLGGLFHKELFFIIIYCFQWSKETLHTIVWNLSWDNRRGKEVLCKVPSSSEDLCSALVTITYGGHFRLGQKPIEIHTNISVHVNQTRHDHVLLFAVGRSRKKMSLPPFPEHGFTYIEKFCYRHRFKCS